MILISDHAIFQLVIEIMLFIQLMILISDHAISSVGDSDHAIYSFDDTDYAIYSVDDTDHALVCEEEMMMHSEDCEEVEEEVIELGMHFLYLL